jgi:hypothetical protein
MDMDIVDAVSSDSIQNTNSYDAQEEKASEISSFAKKRIEESKPPTDSTKAPIVFCAEERKEDGVPKDNWHGTAGVYGKKDFEGNKSLNFDFRQQYQDYKSHTETSGRGSVSIDQKGRVAGEIGLERRW